MSKLALSLFAACLLGAGTADAADPVEISVVIKDHRFQPADIALPADTPIMFRVANKDATPEEFESGDLGFEKVIPAGTEGVVWAAPLKPGHYTFFGDFNPATAQGKITVQ